MAKTIKFNLVCDQKPVRTIEDLQKNFSTEDVLAYYHNGLLARWLKVRGYNEQLEQINAITDTADIDIIHELIDIFAVAADDCTVDESVFALEYLQARKEQLELYQKENFEKQRIIRDYAAGYQALVEELLEYHDDIAAIKGAIKEIVSNYAWALELDHRNLFYTLHKENGWLALMCMLMVDECRKYYLPIETKNEDGTVVLDTGTNQDKENMHLILKRFACSAAAKKVLGDDLCRFSGETDNYWKDLGTKGKKYMIINMEEGDHVRSIGRQGEDFSSRDVKGKFTILNGVDYKSNNASHTLLYMEV